MRENGGKAGLLRRRNGYWTYDGVWSDFTPCPFLALAHLLERVLLREAEDVAGVWFGQAAHGFLEGRWEDSTRHMDAIPLFTRFSVFLRARRFRRSS